MHCDECKTEPLTPGHFCECCGRKLSLQERRVLENSWVEPARPPQPVVNNDPRAGTQLIPELYVEPVVTSEPAPVEIDPALEERFAQFAKGAVSIANDEPARNAGEPRSAGDESSPVVVRAEAVVEEVAEAAAAPHAIVDSFLEAHFAGQQPAATSHVTPVLAPSPVEDSPFAQVQARLRAHTTSSAAAVMDLPPVEVPATHDDADVRGSRCESCGGPADDGELCAACKNAFHSAFDNSGRPQPSPDVETTVFLPPSVSPAQPSPVADTPVISVPAAVAPVVAVAPVAAAAPAAAAPSPAAPALERAPEPPKIRIRAEQPAAPVATQTEVEHQAVAEATARPARPKLVATSSPKSSAPAKPFVTPNVPAAARSRIATVGAAAAVVVVLAAIGFPLSRLWLGGYESSPVIREEPSAPAAATPAPTPAASPAVVDPAPATVAVAEAATPAPAAPVALGPARPAAPPAARVAAAKLPPKNARLVVPVKQVAVAPASSPVVAVVAEVAVPVPVVVPEPRPEPPAPALGPFYELRDVNVPPAVAMRVEPQVPEELRASAANEIVIARVLVSQSGRAQTVTLLRKSKAGAALDDAIVAAVKQWTFAPARRRGEPVSCWYNLGVPVGR